jgi:hypothetical protein
MRAVGFAFGVMLAFASGVPALAADAPPAAPPTVNLDQLRGGLIGTWQNTADPGFTRELDRDGTATERYEGDDSATASGHWLLFAGTAQPADMAARKLPADGVYLEVSTHGDLYLFALQSLDPQSLQMVSLDRKQSLIFSRLK